MDFNENTFAHMIDRAGGDDSLRSEHQQQLREQVLEVFDHALTGTSQRAVFASFLANWSWIMRSPTFRFSTGAVFVLAIAGVALWFHVSGTQYAFADFVKPILEAKSAKFKVAFERNGKQVATANCMVLAPNRTRMELQQPGQPVELMIADYSKGVMVRIDSARKVAIVNKVVGLSPEQASMNPLDEMRSLILDAGKRNVKRESLGEKEVDGRRAVGWRISGPGLYDPGLTATIWGDPQTGLPICIESSYALDGQKSTCSDFTFDVDFDESMFSLDPPVGYTVRTMQVDASSPTENDLINLLREYNKWMNNAFPEALDMNRLERTLQARIRIETMSPGNERPSDELLQKITDGTEEEIGKIIQAEMLEKAKADRTSQTRNAESDKENAKNAGQKAMDAFTAKFTGVDMMITRGLAFAFTLPADANAHYDGKGVSFGAADKPIFWYRPKDAKTYRVIYADLAVRDAGTPPSVPHTRVLPADVKHVWQPPAWQPIAAPKNK